MIDARLPKPDRDESATPMPIAQCIPSGIGLGSSLTISAPSGGAIGMQAFETWPTT